MAQPPPPPPLNLEPIEDYCKLNRKQDLPPPGGYPKIPWKRNPAKKVFNGYTIFAGYLAMTAVSMYLYGVNYRKIKKHEIEMYSHKMAIWPILLAERDREYLKQIHKNREEEAKLMKDVPGWEVGTYYGEKVYLMKGDDEFVEPIFHEYFAHCSPRTWFKRAYHALRC